MCFNMSILPLLKAYLEQCVDSLALAFRLDGQECEVKEVKKFETPELLSLKDS